MSRFYLLHILVMSSLLNSTLLVYWDNILVDLAQYLRNTTEYLFSYRNISLKIFEFSLINKTFCLNWENLVPIKRSSPQLTETFIINCMEMIPSQRTVPIKRNRVYFILYIYVGITYWFRIHFTSIFSTSILFNKITLYNNNSCYLTYH